MTSALGGVYLYLRIDASADISSDTLELSLDEKIWSSSTVTYIDGPDLPDDIADVGVANPPAAGRLGYWWRVDTGPLGGLQLARGRQRVYGRLTDNPETPHIGWIVTVPWYG